MIQGRVTRTKPAIRKQWPRSAGVNTKPTNHETKTTEANQLESSPQTRAIPAQNRTVAESERIEAKDRTETDVWLQHGDRIGTLPHGPYKRTAKAQRPATAG
jgi:hypothetical protein